MYVNYTIEVLTTVAHIFIRQLLGSFLCVCVQVCVHTVGTVVRTQVKGEAGRERAGNQPPSPCAGEEGKKRNLNSPRAITKVSAQIEMVLLKTLNLHVEPGTSPSPPPECLSTLPCGWLMAA